MKTVRVHVIEYTKIYSHYCFPIVADEQEPIVADEQENLNANLRIAAQNSNEAVVSRNGNYYQ